MAQGEYIWLPDDDDLYNIDIICYILNMAQNFEFDHLFLRAAGIQPHSARSAEQVSSHELLARTTTFTTFMTSQVIRGTLIKKHLDVSRPYLGGFMAYYNVLLSVLADSIICLISDCIELCAASAENTGGYKFYDV